MSMLKLCKCNKPIPLNISLCDSCAPKVEQYTKARNKQRHKIYDEKRDKKYVQFYNSKEWKSIRQVALVRDNGLCVICLGKNTTRSASMVDHIVPTKISWELKLNINNLQSLCNKCHTRKTEDDKKKYKGLL